MIGSTETPRVVFLYSELSYYFLSGLNSLNPEEVEVSVVHWDVNPDAPFQFRFPEHVDFWKRSEHSDEQLMEKLEALQPELIFCAGWLDKGYLKLIRKLKGPKKILTMDNQWTGSMRQWIGALSFRFTFLSDFDGIWVQGERQKRFALKLGFKEHNVHMNFYSADLNLFNEVYRSNLAAKTQNYPHTFLYLGRYAPEKGIDDLIEAFEEWKEKSSNDWKLICVGTGPLRSKYDNTEWVEHRGFIQPYDLGTVIRDAGVFVLPSTFEPWGLVVHECAASGLPIISSNKVGSSDLFVGPENGKVIPSRDRSKLVEALDEMAGKTDDELLEMSRQSHLAGQLITPKMWAEKLISFLN